jgi:hypothetical protein
MAMLTQAQSGQIQAIINRIYITASRSGVRIVGNLQKMHGEFKHYRQILLQIEKMASSGKYTEIYFNMSVQRAAEMARACILKCLQRPDIIAKTKDGVLKLFEFVSTKSQNVKMLEDKIAILVKMFSDILGRGGVFVP